MVIRGLASEGNARSISYNNAQFLLDDGISAQRLPYVLLSMETYSYISQRMACLQVQLLQDKGSSP